MLQSLKMVPVKGHDPGVNVEQDRQPTPFVDGSGAIVPQPSPEFVQKGQPNVTVLELQAGSRERTTCQEFELYGSDQVCYGVAIVQLNLAEELRRQLATQSRKPIAHFPLESKKAK